MESGHRKGHSPPKHGSSPSALENASKKVGTLLGLFALSNLKYAYSDTGYSDIPATVIVFSRPNTVTVSGEACTNNWTV